MSNKPNKKPAKKVKTVKQQPSKIVGGGTEAEQRSDPTPRKTLWELAGNSTPISTKTGTSSTSFSAKSVDPIVVDAVASSATNPSTKPTSTISSLLKSTINDDNNDSLTPPHLIIEARAGTGKTTTIVEGLNRMRGIESNLVPSPQQAAVWDQMALSRDAKTVCFVAFNKSIATELQQRVPPGCDAMTMHSMGFKAVMNALGRLEPNQYTVQDIIADILGVDARQLKRTDPLLLSATDDLVSLCKMNLVDHTIRNGSYGGVHSDMRVLWSDALEGLVTHYEVDLGKHRNQVFDLVPQVLERCRDPRGKITFDDMIWLPVVLNLPVNQYDVLLVDEAQDLNRCQQALAKKAGRRLILCGDPRQAIYGFAGADAESMNRMERELADVEYNFTAKEKVGDPGTVKYEGCKGSGCIKLPLTVTRRCGHAIVAEARKIVPDFEAFETNPVGIISEARFPTNDDEPGNPGVTWEKSYGPTVQDGDMCLCRVNAPLVSQCFKFIKAGRKANIQGRDVAKGLISTANKMKAISVVDLVHKLSDWANSESAKEQAKRDPNEQRLIAIADRFDCLLCFTEGANSVDDVLKKIDVVFTDNKDVPGIRLSSIHKAKGLEAKRVFLLEPKGATVPHPMAKTPWQREQEMNLRYVAITRAIEELIYVS